jgi:uncharacterized protein DUF4294
MSQKSLAIWVIFIILSITGGMVIAQNSANDTIRLGSVGENGKNYPMVFLPEFIKTSELMDQDDRKRRNRLRNDVFVVYPYALTAASIFKDVNTKLDNLDSRRDRKKYLKSIDKTLDNTFKEPLKNLSVDQGHVLIKLIDRQTGQNCYSIIKELKGGFSAVLWQSVGVFFSNNLARDYDPEGRDKEVEDIVKELEASAAYRYQLYQQEALLKKVKRP